MANRALWQRLSLIALVVALAALSGCGGAPEAKLEVHEPRAMLTPHMGAVYFTVVNPGSRSDRLLRVETGAAERAETHETVEENGVMKMRERPEGFEVPAGGTLELQPGGKHVMLVGPRAQNDSVDGIGLTLHFEHAGAIEVQAAVTPMGGMGGGHP